MECKGEHDLTTRRALEDLLSTLVADNDLVVVDVSETEFVDSSFIHNVVKADRASRAHGKRLRLQVGTAPIVERALEVSGILEHIEHASTREEALNRKISRTAVRPTPREFPAELELSKVADGVSVTEWRLVGVPIPVNHARDRRSDTDYGWRFRAVNSSGAETKVHVEQFRGGPGRITAARARSALDPYLDNPVLPRRLVMDFDKRFRPDR